MSIQLILIQKNTVSIDLYKAPATLACPTLWTIILGYFCQHVIQSLLVVESATFCEEHAKEMVRLIVYPHYTAIHTGGILTIRTFHSA